MPESKARILRLVLGDQLNHRHTWFQSRDNTVDYLLMENRQETDYVLHHIQKVAGFFLAMRRFAAWLKAEGHNVIYLKLDDRINRQDFDENIKYLIKKKRYDRFEYMLPDEYRLDVQLLNLSRELPCETEVFDSQHFLTERDEVKNFFQDRKICRMEYFYRHMRKKYDILMEDGQPAGGKWNYDIENRSKFNGQVPLPKKLLFRNDVSDIVNLLNTCSVSSFGRINPKKLIWPVDRNQALKLLNFFIRHQLPFFGTYQDAMISSDWLLFHSRISFALNIKLLHPLTVIKKVIGAWKDRPGEISLPQAEGFIRQILGWREYMRGMYWKLMPEFARMNYFRHRRRLPRFFWDGNTKMNCLAHAIGQSLDHAYAHHIQRLMLTGNFSLLAGIDPAEVDAWYLGVYIDAIEWVEMPNTRGMSQFADGGITASKPYVSTANYINSMSDYCRECDYSFKVKFGKNACPFNCLHWNFYHRHRKKLGHNPRLGNMYRVWDKMDDDERENILDQARKYLKALEKL